MSRVSRVARHQQDMDSQQDPLFLALRDSCLRCIESPTLESVRTLSNIVSAADASVLLPIQKYIMFPLKQMLSKYHSDPVRQLPVLCESCSCLQALLTKTSVQSFQEFADIFVSLFMLADQRLQTTSAPEDLRVHSLEAAYTLIQSASASVMQQALHDSLFLKALGHAVSVLLSVATRDSCKSLQITAVKTLHLWFQRSETLAIQQRAERIELSHVYRGFLPGLSIAVMKLLTRDDKLPQALVCTSVSLLSLSICLAMPSGAEADERVAAHVRESGKNLRVIIAKIGPDLTKSTQIAVRRSFLMLCTSIVSNCSALLMESLQHVLLDSLLTLSMDEEDSLKNEAGDFVTSVLQSDTTYANRVYEDLEQKVLECMESLMEQISTDECSSELQKVLPGLQLLAGMFSMMHPRGCNLFMNIPSHRHHFVRFSVRVCRLLLQQQSQMRSNLLNESGKLEFEPLRFGDEAKGLQLIRSMVRFIASKVDQDVTEDILNDLHEQSIAHPEAIFAANQIVSTGLKGGIGRMHVENCQSLLQHHCNTGQPLTGKAVTRVSLATEGLAIGLQDEASFGQRDGDDFLPMIYLLLNILSYQVSRTSSSCENVLSLLSQQLHYRSIDEMLQDKLSYLTSRLQKDQQLMPGSSNTAKLLQTLLPFCSRLSVAAFVPLIESSLQTLDSIYFKNPTPVLQTLLVFLNFISKKGSVRHSEFTGPEERGPLLSLSDFESKWGQFVADIKAADKADADIMEQETRDQDESSRGQQEEEETRSSPTSLSKELPPDAHMCKMILEKCSNLLALPDSCDRIRVLDIISEVANILKEYEDLFLPFVHKIWKQLVLRLSDEVPVARTAFHLLLVLSEVCGHFIEQRTITDVLPKIIAFLSQHLPDGVRKQTRTSHRFTITFKYQWECLKKIGPLTVGLNVQGKELWKLIAVVLHYVSPDQEKELRQAAGQAIRSFWSLDPDSVWFYCQHTLDPQSPEFTLISQSLFP